MRKVILFLGFMIGLVLASPSWATSGYGSTYKTSFNYPVNSSGYLTATSNGVVTGGYQMIAIPGQPISGIMLSGGASGGTVAIYDSNLPTSSASVSSCTNLGGYSSCEVVFEATVGSNTQTYIDLSQTPINTNNGIGVTVSSTAGAVIYTNPAITTNK